MTDNEIIKALKCCKGKGCKGCPCDVNGSNCITTLMEIALDLIKRQNAENERLKDHNNNLQTANTALSIEILDIKSEAIREFAEELTDRIAHNDEIVNRDSWVITSVINNLVKERTESEELK